MKTTDEVEEVRGYAVVEVEPMAAAGDVGVVGNSSSS